MRFDSTRRLLIEHLCLLLCVPLVAQARQPAKRAAAAKVLDVMRVHADGDAAEAVVALAPGVEEQHHCDVVVIGGGMGGVSTAYEAARAGLTVCMTEPTLWIGGQMTSEGVSAFDENKWIETTGSTLTYSDLRERIREAYYAKTAAGSKPVTHALTNFNPGNCWVSRLCFEPLPAEQVLQNMLQPLIAEGKLRIWIHTVPVRVLRHGRTIESVQAYDLEHKTWLRFEGSYFVDATEWGDVLGLSGLPFRLGAESKSETGERNAPAQPDPKDIQSFTYPFLLVRMPKVSAKDGGAPPPDYASLKTHYSFAVDYGHGKILTYSMFGKTPGTPGSFWTYRRAVDAAQFRPGIFSGDVSMINWDSNDYCDARLLSGDPLEEAEALQGAKRLSLGFVWWLERDAPRDDHTGLGYPRLELDAAGMGSMDGLAQQPYIRESRRIIPLRTIVEEDLAVDFQKGARAALYPDSVGIGQYPIDIHSCARKDFTSATKPYEIPLGALIDRDADNLLAASKDIGTTHITNGAYRLHPTEWAIGEAAGATIAWSLKHDTTPEQLDGNPKTLAEFQRWLVKQGHPIFWFDDVPETSPLFDAVQIAAAQQWLPVDPSTLHFMADSRLTGAEVAKAIEQAGLRSRIGSDVLSHIRENGTIQWNDLRSNGLSIQKNSGPITRGDLAVWLFQQTKP